ncbi:2Fe-2S iron-sulfur cluster binding domain-containing protein [Patescibacteria group bacterium]|nr:2Fe-2S iron-sulfur cluster binding domain-containing protein [Patescibacteria group bacterium]MBU1016405.1 2Fe-2S iron-sulfur cluster binding domain-containing protein [Patescibacteria group bacterium]
MNCLNNPDKVTTDINKNIMVTVHVNGKDYKVDENSEKDLMHQLKEQGAEIVAACNGAGICQTCAIKVNSGKLTEKTETEKMMDLPEGQRLSCQCRAQSDLDIELIY